MNNYLLELGVEEFPAAYVELTKKQLIDGFEKTFKENKISCGEFRVETTPRRFVVYALEMELESVSEKVKVKGPSKKIALDQEGNPSKALLGFLRGQIKTIDDVYYEVQGKDEYVFIDKVIEQKPIVEVLKEAVPNIIRSLNFPKAMKWGGRSFRFARPLRWIVSIFDDEVLAFEFENIPVSNISKGHRILGKSQIEIDKIDNFENLLKENGVILKQEDRRNIILRGANLLSKEKGGNLYNDEKLLDEIVNITEYPTPLIGKIKDEFLSLPKEVIITPMKDHQRYFPIVDDKGELLPFFITVRNGDEKGLDQVRKGNEKVLAPRLEDAKFFFDEDIKYGLENYVEVLKTATFHEKLGTIYDKTKRLEKLSKMLGEELEVGETTIENLERAAQLSKADLVSKLVIEFTELQGIMGRLYAKRMGENDLVCDAIMEQYLPRFSGDSLPKSTCGKILSITDKIDTIVGMYAAGVRVTGSQDPFALRRAALGLINIILESNLSVDLDTGIRNALYTYLEDFNLVFDYDEVKADVVDFIKQRMRVKLISDGFRYDIVDSVFAIDSNNLCQLFEKTKAVSLWEAENTQGLQAITRLESILKGYDKEEIDEGLLKEEAELRIFNSLYILNDVQEEIDGGNYEEALKLLARLESDINAYLDSTMIMVEDEALKETRLGILSRIYKKIRQIFVPSLIVKQE